MKDPYARPSREEIAARVLTQQHGTANADDDPIEVAVTPREPQGTALANFAVHLSARMRALGWDAARLADKAGLSQIAVSRAAAGTSASLEIAEKLAGLVGGYLATMIGPYMCSTCTGEPPAGFACLECGAETRAA